MPIRRRLACSVVRTVAGILTGSLLLAAALPWASAAQRSSASASLTQAEAQLHIDPEAGRREADAALEALQREPDIDLEIRARLVLCDYYAERDRDQAAAQIAVLNTLLPRAQQPGLAAGVLNCQGKALEISAAGAQARTLYDQAVSVAGGAHDDRMLAQALLARGDVRGSTGAYAAGLSDLRAAQALFEQQKTPQQALTALDSIAIIYDRMGDYSEAAQMFKRAIAAQHDAGLRREEAVTWYNLGRTYEYLHQWESARSAFKFALESSTQLGYVRMQAYASRGLASIANAQDNPDEALALLLRSRNWQQQTPDALLLAQIELTAGRVLHRLGRLQDSAASLEQALAVFQQADSPAELAETYGELAAVRAELGDWRAAYDARSLAQSTATRLLRNQLDQRFAMLKVEFDTDSQAKRNALLMQENEANEQALAQQLKANNLQTAVTVLSVLLLAVLATLAVHQRRNSRRLRTLAMTDELTGIANRRALLTRLSRLLRRSTTPSSILIIDIDHFKTINDRHGHLVGDETLKVMTAALRDGLDKPAFFGRLGGEEFAAILPDTAIAEACAIAERLRERVMRIDLSRWLGDRRMTVSIGIAVSVPIRDTTSSMLRRADAALYAAKDAGRNCVRCEAAAALPEITPRVA